MLKKCVVLPNSEMHNEQLANSSFKRGVMQFEDYNYTMFNPYILIESKEDEADDEIKVNLNERELTRARVPTYSFDEIMPQQYKPEANVSQLL